MLTGALTAKLFAVVLDELNLPLWPTVFVLDNACIHRAACVQACQAKWDARGLRLQFFLPYHAKLSKIELLWHRCKHCWLTPANFESDQSLLEQLPDLLLQICERYTISFA